MGKRKGSIERKGTRIDVGHLFRRRKQRERKAQKESAGALSVHVMAYAKAKQKRLWDRRSRSVVPQWPRGWMKITKKKKKKYDPNVFPLQKPKKTIYHFPESGRRGPERESGVQNRWGGPNNKEQSKATTKKKGKEEQRQWSGLQNAICQRHKHNGEWQER